MAAHRARLAPAAIALVFDLGPSSQAAGPPQATSYGVAIGTWNLPGGGNSQGLFGYLEREDGQTQVFRFEAHFHELASPEPGRREGIVHGHLFEPSGSAPVYLVYGSWELDAASGQGRFYAPIYDLENVFVTADGRIGGRFFEPPGAPTPGLGTFAARWGLAAH